MIARLKPGASIAQLNEQMKVITEHVIDRLPARAGFMKTSQFGGFAVGMRDQFVGDVRTQMYMLQVGVLLVLFIACANVANLHAHARDRTQPRAGDPDDARRRAVAHRPADADRRDRDLARRRRRRHRRRPDRPAGAHRDGRTADARHDPKRRSTRSCSRSRSALAMLTGLVFGVVPALAITRGNAASFLKDDSRSGTASKGTGAMRALLVVAETMFAVMLLIGAGLLLKSFARLQSVDPGFATENVLTAQIALPAARYPDAPRIAPSGRGCSSRRARFPA